jgi:hypothetical protein
MQLDPGRRDWMEREALRRESCIDCHDTLDGPRTICRGFWNRHKDDVLGLQLAQAFSVVEFVAVPECRR